MNKYFIEDTSNGWAIFCNGYWNEKIFISNQLSKKQASKWCTRLNIAYKRGIESQY